MIKLNVEDGLVRIESWNDVLGLPGFTQDIHSSAFKFDSIIGSYDLGYDVLCGLRDCRTAHRRGYVASSGDGRKTNLGNVCGKKYFSVEFSRAKRAFDNDIKQKELREALAHEKRNLDMYKSEILALKSGQKCVAWAQKGISRLSVRNGGVPESVYLSLSSMVRERNPVVYVEEKLDEKERSIQNELGNGNSIYKRKAVARLEGFDALYEENNLRRLLVDGVEAVVRELDFADIDSLPTQVLSALAKKAGGIWQKIEKSKVILEQARALLTVENLSKLTVLAKNEKDKTELRSFIQKVC